MAPGTFDDFGTRGGQGPGATPSKVQKPSHKHQPCDVKGGHEPNAWLSMVTMGMKGQLMTLVDAARSGD